MTRGIVASLDWRACDECDCFEADGCMQPFVSLSVYMGEFAVCDCFGEKPDVEEDGNSPNPDQLTLDAPGGEAECRGT